MYTMPRPFRAGHKKERTFHLPVNSIYWSTVQDIGIHRPWVISSNFQVRAHQAFKGMPPWVPPLKPYPTPRAPSFVASNAE